MVIGEVDDYFWLRDDNREDPEVLDYLKQENAYTQAQMAPLAGLEEELYQEMVARQEPKLESLPYFKKGFWYISRFAEGQEFTVYTRRKGTMDASEELLLDCNARAQGQSYYQLGDLALSADSMLMAFSEDLLGRRQYTLRVKDLCSWQPCLPIKLTMSRQWFGQMIIKPFSILNSIRKPCCLIRFTGIVWVIR